LTLVISTGRRNGVCEDFSWCSPVERLAGACVEFTGNGIELALRYPAEICPFRKVLTE
jgi:hypothetical protein